MEKKKDNCGTQPLNPKKQRKKKKKTGGWALPRFHTNFSSWNPSPLRFSAFPRALAALASDEVQDQLHQEDEVADRLDGAQAASQTEFSSRSLMGGSGSGFWAGDGQGTAERR